MLELSSSDFKNGTENCKYIFSQYNEKSKLRKLWMTSFTSLPEGNKQDIHIKGVQIRISNVSFYS